MSPTRKREAEALRHLIMTSAQDLLAQDRARGLNLIAVHQVNPRFHFLSGYRPDATHFKSYERSVRRQCERSASVTHLIGIIEPSFNLRQGMVRIQLGFHGIAAIEAEDERTAVTFAQRAFSLKSDPELGIYRPSRVNTLDSTKGGLRGALGYASKSLEEEAVTRRSSYKDATGRWNTRDFGLRASEQRDLDLIFEAVTPHEQRVLYGIRCVKKKYVDLKQRCLRFT